MGIRDELLGMRKKPMHRPAKWEGSVPKSFKNKSQHEMKIWVREQLCGGPPGEPRLASNRRRLKWRDLSDNIGRKIIIESDPPGRIRKDREGKETWKRSLGALSANTQATLGLDLDEQRDNEKLAIDLDDLFKGLFIRYNRKIYERMTTQEKLRIRWEIGRQLTEFLEKDGLGLSRDALYQELLQLGVGLQERGFTPYRYRYDCKMYYLARDAQKDHPLFSINDPELIQYICDSSTRIYDAIHYPRLSEVQLDNAKQRFVKLLRACRDDGAFSKLSQKEFEKVHKTDFAEIVAENGSLSESEYTQMMEFIHQVDSEEE